MATTDTAKAPVMQRSGFERRALAVLMPVGPLTIAALRVVLPYDTTDPSAVVAAKVAEHPTAQLVVLWLSLVATLTLVPGVIAVGMLARSSSRWWGTIGLVVSVAAFMNLFGPGVAGPDAVALGAADIGMSPAITGPLLDGISAIGPVGLGTAIFVFGHIIGVLLLGIALWRGHVVPGWTALLLAISQPLHLVFAVFVPNHPLDGCAWALTAVGFIAAAVALLRDRPTGVHHGG
jgi:hypothetical protein